MSGKGTGGSSAERADKPMRGCGPQLGVAFENVQNLCRASLSEEHDETGQDVAGKSAKSALNAAGAGLKTVYLNDSFTTDSEWNLYSSANEIAYDEQVSDSTAGSSLNTWLSDGGNCTRPVKVPGGNLEQADGGGQSDNGNVKRNNCKQTEKSNTASDSVEPMANANNLLQQGSKSIETTFTFVKENGLMMVKCNKANHTQVEQVTTANNDNSTVAYEIPSESSNPRMLNIYAGFNLQKMKAKLTDSKKAAKWWKLLNSHTHEANETEADSKIPKNNLYDELRRMIESGTGTDVEVLLDDTVFYCHMLVLRAYSGKFAACPRRAHLVKLSSERVRPLTFARIYKWMLEDAPELQLEGILEVLVGAHYLEIPLLEHYCWQVLHDKVYGHDQLAFEIYRESRLLGTYNLDKLFLQHIRKFFLVLIASKHFVNMNLAEATALLSQTRIAVFSQQQLFFCAVRWLSHSWPQRQHATLEIMQCVPFALMPPNFLMKQLHGDEKEVQRVVEHAGVHDLLLESISFAMLEIQGQSTVAEQVFLRRAGLKPPTPRSILKFAETESKDARELRAMVNNCEETFKDFEILMVKLKQIGMKFYELIELEAACDETYFCCTNSN